MDELMTEEEIDQDYASMCMRSGVVPDDIGRLLFKAGWCAGYQRAAQRYLKEMKACLGSI